MIDPEYSLRRHLTTLAPVVSALTGGIYAGSYLPPGYAPASNGPAALFAVRGGSPEYHQQVWRVSVQVRVYAETETKARTAMAALHDQANETRSKSIMWMELEAGTVPTLLHDPETAWPYMLAYYSLYVRA